MNEETETPETIAAILAEMRDFARPLRVGGDLCSNVALPATISIWADRIEAAAERERIELREDEAKMLLREYAAAPDESLTPSALELKRELLRLAPAPGNAAALREALENLVHRKCLVSGSCSKPIAEQCDHPSCVWYECRAALAAPARNCDRFQTLDEAREAFQKLREHKVWADVELWDSMDEAGAFVRWLFAPAEGGAE